MSKNLEEGNLTPAVSYLKITAIFTVIVLIAVFILSIVFILNSEEDTKEKNNELTSYVPSSFYPKIEKKSSSENVENVSSELIPINQSAINRFKHLRKVKVENDDQALTESKIEVKEVKEVKKDFVSHVVEPIEPKKPSDAELKRLFILQQLENLKNERKLVLLSRRGNKSNGWGIPNTTVNDIANVDEKDPTFVNDFSSNGVAKDTSTLKVDLSRTITADRYIPCVLVDQINSQIAGRATCRSESNVFGFHGRKILIPAGTVFIGRHDTLKKVGDERFNISWSRLIRPDGVHVSLTDAYGSDLIGGTGIAGEVNNRNWDKYSGALLTSTISLLGQISIPTSSSVLTSSAVESYGTDLGRVSAAILQEKINIKAYSVVPAGTRVLVTPSTDIWLKKVKNNYVFSNVNK